MSRPEKDKILEHDYDGIRELDNPLPGWWVLIFWASILWAGGYALWHHAGPGVKARQERFAALDATLAEKAAAASRPADFSRFEGAILAMARDEAGLAAGKEIFATRCMPCHGMQGEGLVGPNLTDDHVIHGWRLADIYRTIHEGVPEKGMIPWKGQMSEQQMQQAAAFVATLRATDPPNQKAPEGVPAEGNPLQ